MKIRVLTLLLTMLTAAPTFAAHPLVGDDTGTHGSGKYQLEINSEAGFDRKNSNGLETRTSTRQVAAIISAGFGESLDLVVGLPWQRTREARDGSPAMEASGVGDASLDLKWRFFEREGFSLAVKPGVTLATGNEDRGLGTGRLSGGVTIIATKSIDPVTVHMNTTYFRNEFSREADRQTNRSDIIRASLAAITQVARNLQLAVEVGLESSSDRSSRKWPAYVTAGLIYRLGDNVDLDLGVKHGLNDPATDLTLLAGFSRHF